MSRPVPGSASSLTRTCWTPTNVRRRVARGSSDNAASYGVYAFGLLPRWTALRDSITLTVYFQSGPDLAGSTIVALSQSGRTQDVVEYVERARAAGAFTVAITNDPASELAARADAVLPIAAGSERAVAATKTYLNQLAALGLLAAHAAGRIRHRHGIVGAAHAASARGMPHADRGLADEGFQRLVRPVGDHLDAGKALLGRPRAARVDHGHRVAGELRHRHQRLGDMHGADDDQTRRRIVDMDEDAAALHDLDDAAPDDLGRVPPVDRLALELDPALGDVAPLGAEQTRDGLEGGRLAGAVGPEEGDDAPRGDPERDALQHQDDVIVDHLDVVDRQQNRARAWVQRHVRKRLHSSSFRRLLNKVSRRLSELPQHLRTVRFFSLACFAAASSTIGRTMALSGWIQSVRTFHLAPSHSMNLTAPPPS